MNNFLGIKSLPTLRQLVRENNLFLKKSLGQHFLFNMDLNHRIARLSNPLKKGTIIEIGPGPGGITRALLLEGAKNVIAIEKDSNCVRMLQSLVKVSKKCLIVLEEDAMTLNIKELGPSPYRIISNLPYNISIDFLISFLKQSMLFESFTLMFQKEVADRLLAPPFSKGYCSLSVLTQFSCKVTRIFDILPKFFFPIPKVKSSLMFLSPCRKLLSSRMSSQKIIERVVRAAFAQRRKMLRVSLRSLSSKAELLLERAGINPTSRAEELTVKEFDRLANVFNEYYC